MRLFSFLRVVAIQAAQIVGVRRSVLTLTIPGSSRNESGELETCTLDIGYDWLTHNAVKVGDYIVRENHGYRLVKQKVFEEQCRFVESASDMEAEFKEAYPLSVGEDDVEETGLVDDLGDEDPATDLVDPDPPHAA